jgi:ABC-type bacteriocin/lantibiotic exporter with double-glycine peptidase domain
MLANSVLVFASPFINGFCCILIGNTIGWYYSLGMVLFWFFLIIIANFAGMLLKYLKNHESMYNDERLKLINDMIVGIRTIKSYAWENHYMNKIKSMRGKQMKY